MKKQYDHGPLDRIKILEQERINEMVYALIDHAETTSLELREAYDIDPCIINLWLVQRLRKAWRDVEAWRAAEMSAAGYPRYAIAHALDLNTASSILRAFPGLDAIKEAIERGEDKVTFGDMVVEI